LQKVKKRFPLDKGFFLAPFKTPPVIISLAILRIVSLSTVSVICSVLWKLTWLVSYPEYFAFFFQVTEEDIALSLGILENPLPEVDQRCLTGSCRFRFPLGGPHDHPLRVLSQENLTVVSTFAGECTL